MKRTSRFLIKLVVVLFVLLAAIQLFLSFGLAPLIRSAVLPGASAEMGAEIGIGGASADLLGRTHLRDVRFGNPAGFSEPSLLTVGRQDNDIALLSLLRGVVEVSDARMEDVVVTVVRNRDGRVNTSEFSKPVGEKPAAPAGKPGTGREQPKPGQGQYQEPQPAPEPMQPALLRSMAVDGQIVYVDHTPAGAPLRLAFPTEIRAENLATFPQPGGQRGKFTLRAHLADNPAAFATDLRGTVEPVSDPNRPTFDLKGSIARIDFQTVAALAGTSDVQAESADVQVRVTCRRGVFVAPSEFVVTLRNISVQGKMARKSRGMPVPKDLVITVPLEGTISEPMMDVESAVIRSLLESLASNPDALIRSLKADEKTGKDIEKGLKSLGDLFK